ncbi:odorant receptor 49b-like [Odontomachus brunneus]|uniref:odorant receptor 49b-like n=1 Tax=Odontomachus brunneus TaxID=486640 RepID=UPI0013F1DE50|nr:odorant receptor 49b-like [Odontomachus brunneus]
MARKITPKAVVVFLKLTIFLCFSWPPPKTASRFQVIRFKTLRFLLCINAVVLIMPVIYTLYDDYTLYNDYDLATLTKLWCLLGAFVQVPVEVTLFALQYDRLQDLISEMEHCFECAEAHEKDVYQRYVNKCVPFYAASTLSVFFTAVIPLVIPLITVDQVFPTEARYPFDVEYEPLKTIIFVQQFIVAWQCFSNVCHGSFIGILIWFTVARFEILSQQFRAVNGAREIIICIRQHVKLLRYAREVITAIRSVMLLIIIVCSWVFVASGLTIIGQSTVEDKSRFIILSTAALLEVYACAWPADYLMEASTDVSQAIYDSLWYNQSVTFQRKICFLLLRSQIPVAISVSAFLPAISLHYYASVRSSNSAILPVHRPQNVTTSREQSRTTNSCYNHKVYNKLE